MLNYEKNILFILPVATQPRFAKRITTFLEKNYIVTVASFERSYFDKNTLPEKIDFINLGKVSNGKYFKRIPRVLRSFKKLLPLINKSATIIFFTPELFILLSPFLKRKKIIFEIGDIREIQSHNFFTSVYDFFYKKALIGCTEIYVTSEGFKEYIAQKYKIDIKKFTVIENKLLKKHFFLDRRPQFKISERLTVGIIGLFRYNNILQFLNKFQKINPSYNVILYGDGPLKSEILKYVDGQKIIYKGQFEYPSDLSEIYKEIDISFTMYDSNDLNVKLALPNKLYESAYFRKPIIVSENTFLEKKVLEWGVGFSWHQDEMEDLVKFIASHDFKAQVLKLERNFEKLYINDYLV